MLTLSSAPPAACSAGLGVDFGPGRLDHRVMLITDIRVHTCFAMWRNWVFVELVTDRGLIGVGEATLEGREHTMTGHLEDLHRALVGRDPRDLDMSALRDRLRADGAILEVADAPEAVVR